MKTPIHVELYYDSQWNDITSDVYTREPVVITRGRGDELSRVSPSVMDLSIKNRDHKYSPRNPGSALFGKIGRNTPVRVYVGDSVPVTGSANWRFHGEIESWPQRWSVNASDDGTKGDVWAPVRAYGIMHRLGLPGQKVLARSAPSRYATINEPAAYWPMTSPRADFGGDDVYPFYAGTELEWRSGELAPWLPNGFVSDRREPLAAKVTSTTVVNECAADWLMRLDPPSDENGTSQVSIGIQFVGGGPVVLMFAEIDATVPLLELSDPGIASIDDTDSTNVFDGTLHAWRMHAYNDGSGDATVDVYLDGTLIMTAVSTIESFTGVQLGQFIFGPSDPLIGEDPNRYAIGQIFLWAGTPPPVADVHAAMFGHVSEQAHERVERLCAEEGISLEIIGSTSAEVGPQGINPPLELMFEAAEADGGVLYESRDEFGLTFRTYSDIFDQASTVSLDYSAGGQIAPPLLMTEDTWHINNDVTVSRRDGGFHREIQSSGSLNVQEPVDDPQGVGRYPVDVELNLYQDSQLGNAADRILRIGTWDEPRYPSIKIDLTALAGEPSELVSLLPEGVTFMWPGSEGSIPAGWNRVTDLDGRYIKGIPNDSTDPGTAGGAASHSHTTSGHAHSLDHSHTSTGNTGAASTSAFVDTSTSPPFFQSPSTHTHTVTSTNTSTANSQSSSPGTSSQDNDLDRLDVIFIESSGVALGVPDEALALMGDIAPTGWDTYTDATNRFLKGATGSSGGATEDSTLDGHAHTIDAHTHSGTSHSHTSTGVGSVSVTLQIFGGSPDTPSGYYTGGSHAHNVTVNSASHASLNTAGGGTSASGTPDLPPWVNARVRQNNTGDVDLPTGIIGIWNNDLASIPSGWNLCDGTNGTPDMIGRYPRGATSSIGFTGGTDSDTHNHASPSHTHSTSGHSHTRTMGALTGSTNSDNIGVGGGGNQNVSPITHSHSIPNTNSTTPTVTTNGSGTLGSTTSEPLHREVAFIQLETPTIVSLADLLTESVKALDVSYRFVVNNPPEWTQPNAIDQLAQGYIETLASHHWTIEVNAAPAGPHLTP